MLSAARSHKCLEGIDENSQAKTRASDDAMNAKKPVSLIRGKPETQKGQACLKYKLHETSVTSC